MHALALRHRFGGKRCGRAGRRGRGDGCGRRREDVLEHAIVILIHRPDANARTLDRQQIAERRDLERGALRRCRAAAEAVWQNDVLPVCSRGAGDARPFDLPVERNRAGLRSSRPRCRRPSRPMRKPTAPGLPQAWDPRSSTRRLARALAGPPGKSMKLSANCNRSMPRRISVPSWVKRVPKLSVTVTVPSKAMDTE